MPGSSSKSLQTRPMCTLTPSGRWRRRPEKKLPALPTFSGAFSQHLKQPASNSPMAASPAFGCETLSPPPPLRPPVHQNQRAALKQPRANHRVGSGGERSTGLQRVSQCDHCRLHSSRLCSWPADRRWRTSGAPLAAPILCPTVCPRTHARRATLSNGIRFEGSRRRGGAVALGDVAGARLHGALLGKLPPLTVPNKIRDRRASDVNVDEQ